jgi:hypothetical protein
MQQIDNLAPTIIKPHNLTAEQLYQAYQQIGTAKNNNDGRDVRFVNASYGKIMRHKGAIDIRTIVPHLKTIFESAVPMMTESPETMEGHKTHTNFKAYHQYLGKIDVNGREFYVRYTIQETNAKPQTLKEGFIPNMMHSAFISNVEIYNNPSDTTVNSQLLSGQQHSQSEGKLDTKLQNFLQTAKNARDNSSKVIDKNGEPQVVYHGTQYGGWTTPKDYGQPPLFFTTNKKTAEGYAKSGGKKIKENIKERKDFNNRNRITPHIYSVFLNIRDNEFIEYDAKGKSYGDYSEVLPYNPITGKQNFLGNIDNMKILSVNEEKPIIVRNIADNKDYSKDEFGDVIIIPLEKGSKKWVKSATGNVGSFSRDSDDIRHHIIGERGAAALDKYNAAKRDFAQKVVESIVNVGAAPTYADIEALHDMEDEVRLHAVSAPFTPPPAKPEWKNYNDLLKYLADMRACTPPLLPKIRQCAIVGRRQHKPQKPNSENGDSRQYQITTWIRSGQ